MKTRGTVPRLFPALGFALIAATGATGPLAAQTTDPAKVAEFERRFAQGQELERAGKLAEARAVFDGILAEEPQAKGSLREAGFISARLGELEKADGYFERLHALVPAYPAAIEALIQINQSLGREVKVQHLLAEFKALHDGGADPVFSASAYFVRERMHVAEAEIVFTQFFDYTQEPNTAWMAEKFDAAGTLQRRLLLNYDPEATAKIRATDPKWAKAQEFILLEHVIRDGRIKSVDAYLQILALPDYAKVRKTFLEVLANTPKPLYSAPADVPVQGADTGAPAASTP